MPFGKLVWALLASLAVADCCSGLRTVPFGRIARLRGGFEGTAGLAAAGVEGGCDPEENKSPLMRGKVSGSCTWGLHRTEADLDSRRSRGEGPFRWTMWSRH